MSAASSVEGFVCQAYLPIIVDTWAVALAETFLYGAYCIMMAFYVQVIWKRGMGRNRLLVFATIALFVLCSLHCILVLVNVATLSRLASGSTNDTRSLEKQLTRLSGAASLVYTTANVLADTIFILRCYAIWNFQKKIIVIPILLTLGVAGGVFSFVKWLRFMDVSTGIGLNNALFTVVVVNDRDFAVATLPLFYLSIGVSLFTTFILIGLTVGRIWMLARTARRVLGAELTGTYHTVCAMILESGALYLCGGAAYLVLALGPVPGLVTNTGQGMGIVLAQLLGIAPTIIAVRVALGQSVENVGASNAADPAGDGVLYIRPESAKVEAV
ncbi:hypothetical protein K438DRAFT_826050 [Mycena galopus ATCC 62051]|nr:hypothetical protein K438DRAFT_826050 [Mycena galopus ATCC 62051]